MSSPAGALVVISCSEPDARVEPSRYLNLSANTTKVIKTAGGRSETAINNIYYIDQATRIGLIIIIQHDGCAWCPGDLDNTLRYDIQALKASPYVRNDIPIVGYSLSLATGQLREVNVQRDAYDAAARQHVLSQMNDFGPFWS